MVELREVLHKPTPPPNTDRWHIILEGGHREELLHALISLAEHAHDPTLSAEWVDYDEIVILVICFDLVDAVVPNFVEQAVQSVSDQIVIVFNGREECHGHNL